MFEALECYFECIFSSSTNYILFLLLIFSFAFGCFFLFTRKPKYMFISQAITGFAIFEGFILMNCPMIAYVWWYLSLILGIMIFFGVIMAFMDTHIKKLGFVGGDILDDLCKEFDAKICVLDTQRVKAFAHKRKIYISMGLLELLEPDEIKAVVAHEYYHIKHSPNRMLSNTLAFASLWFKSYKDEVEADKFAAYLVGREHLVNAFRKLGIRNLEKRMESV